MGNIFPVAEENCLNGGAKTLLIASRVARTACCDEGHGKPCIKTDERNVLCTLERETFVFFLDEMRPL